jgi:hypothetical protein
MYKKTALRRLAKMLPNARDIIKDDELDLDDAAPAASPPPIARASGAASALEQFAQTPVVEPPSSAGTTGGEPDGATDAAEAVSAAHAAAEDSHPATATDTEDPVEVAYARGREAKTAGVQRRALPPEYRDSNHTREALAWQAGARRQRVADLWKQGDEVMNTPTAMTLPTLKLPSRP